MKQFLDFLPLVVFFASISCTTFMPQQRADRRDRRCADLQLGSLSQSRKNGADHVRLVAVFGGLTIASIMMNLLSGR
jgi:hypothetical protein